MIEKIKKKYIGTGAFYRRYLYLALPMILQNAITNLVSFLDNIMVGQLGTEQMSGVAIVNQSETASLGANCTREDFRQQFIGATGGLAVSKDGGTIDALTGATVTSRAVTEGVNTALEFVQEVLK